MSQNEGTIMKYILILFLMSSCTAKVFRDFILGEERILEQLIYDESGFPVGQCQKAEEQSPTRTPRPAVTLNVVKF
jgi:hypothetical protein